MLAGAASRFSGGRILARSHRVRRANNFARRLGAATRGKVASRPLARAARLRGAGQAPNQSIAPVRSGSLIPAPPPPPMSSIIRLLGEPANGCRRSNWRIDFAGAAASEIRLRFSPARELLRYSAGSHSSRRRSLRARGQTRLARALGRAGQQQQVQFSLNPFIYFAFFRAQANSSSASASALSSLVARRSPEPLRPRRRRNQLPESRGAKDVKKEADGLSPLRDDQPTSERKPLRANWRRRRIRRSLARTRFFFFIPFSIAFAGQIWLLRLLRRAEKAVSKC